MTDIWDVYAILAQKENLDKEEKLLKNKLSSYLGLIITQTELNLRRQIDASDLPELSAEDGGSSSNS